jgi:hypothetical protein
MPCYTEWNAYLNEGTPEYASTKAELEAKLKAVKHIVDYYFEVDHLRVPPARYSGEESCIPMDHREFETDDTDSPLDTEVRIIRSIAYHCSCDRIHFTLLYDLVSLLDIHDPGEAGYARIMLACAHEIRAHKGQYL